MNLYEILGIDRGASQVEIKSAYRAKAKQFHPDIVGSSKRAQFEEITAAYAVLMHPERRRRYDETGDCTTANAGGERQAALDLIQSMMDQVLTQFEAKADDIITDDIPAKMKEAVEQVLAELEANIERQKRKVIRLTGFAKRFSAAAGADNILAAMVEYRLHGAETMLINMSRDLGKHRAAIEILTDCRFSADESRPPSPPAVLHPFWQVRVGNITSAWKHGVP